MNSIFNFFNVFDFAFDVFDLAFDVFDLTFDVFHNTICVLECTRIRCFQLNYCLQHSM